MLEIFRIPAFNDNYLWLGTTDHKHAFVVDPGDAEPVLEELKARGLKLTAILLTHKHADHIGGVAILKQHYPGIPVFAHATETIAEATQQVQEGDTVDLTPYHITLKLEVIEVPGHTLGHVAYYSPGGFLFCGDTLFSGGCGRVFEGTYEQMANSLSKLATLPADTQVYCAHEYTLANLKFATTVDPNNTDLADYFHFVKHQRAQQKPTIPATLAIELRVNPFLRCLNPDNVPAFKLKQEAKTPLEAFTLLRQAKDTF